MRKPVLLVVLLAIASSYASEFYASSIMAIPANCSIPMAKLDLPIQMRHLRQAARCTTNQVDCGSYCCARGASCCGTEAGTAKCCNDASLCTKPNLSNNQTSYSCCGTNPTCSDSTCCTQEYPRCCGIACCALKSVCLSPEVSACCPDNTYSVCSTTDEKNIVRTTCCSSSQQCCKGQCCDKGLVCSAGKCLSQGAIAGAVSGSLVGVSVLILACCVLPFGILYFLRKRDKANDKIRKKAHRRTAPGAVKQVPMVKIQAIEDTEPSLTEELRTDLHAPLGTVIPTPEPSMEESEHENTAESVVDVVLDGDDTAAALVEKKKKQLEMFKQKIQKDLVPAMSEIRMYSDPPEPVQRCVLAISILLGKPKTLEKHASYSSLPRQLSFKDYENKRASIGVVPVYNMWSESKKVLNLETIKSLMQIDPTEDNNQAIYEELKSELDGLSEEICFKKGSAPTATLYNFLNTAVELHDAAKELREENSQSSHSN